MGLIKITSPENLPVAEMGWSSNLKLNEPCISLGYPGAYDAKRGVVVRFGRITKPVAENGMIQSTCLMEPGDSGGPLFDIQGRVIGIHSNIRRSLDQNYDVPVDQFRRYWSQLTKGETFRGYSIDVGPDFGFKLSAGGSNFNEEKGADPKEVIPPWSNRCSPRSARFTAGHGERK